MTSKQNRQNKILRIIESEGGTTQEVIQAKLAEFGITSSQSTLSRDLRELGAVKVHEGGRSVYKLSSVGSTVYPAGSISQAIAEFVISCDAIANFLVIKTKPGNARDFCLVLDRQGWTEMLGTLAGDDTILVICRSDADVKSIFDRLK